MAITFTTYVQPDDIAAAIQDFLYDQPEALPADVRAKAREFFRPGGSVSFPVAYFAELLYANDVVDDPTALQLGASAAHYGSINGVDNLGGGRGAAIALALRKRAGESAPTGGWDLPDELPKKRDGFDLTPPPEPEA